MFSEDFITGDFPVLLLLLIVVVLVVVLGEGDTFGEARLEALGLEAVILDNGLSSVFVFVLLTVGVLMTELMVSIE